MEYKKEHREMLYVFSPNSKLITHNSQGSRFKTKDQSQKFKFQGSRIILFPTVFSVFPPLVGGTEGWGRI